MNVFFIAVWIIVAAEKDEARPDKETGRAVHYNRSWSQMVNRLLQKLPPKNS